MRIDAHLHVWHAAQNIPPGVTTIVSHEAEVPCELLLDYMDEHGVERAVLVQPWFRGEDNSYVADAARNSPQQFAAVAVVDPRTPGAHERLAYWVQDRGCRGLRLRPRVPDEAGCFGQPSTFPLWDEAARLRTVVSLLASPEHLATVDRLAERFASVPIVIDHLAHPDVSQGVAGAAFQQLLRLAHRDNVYVKLSGYYYYSREGYPYRDCWPLVRAVYDRFGPKRLIWGSDFPHALLKVDYGRNLRLPERFYTFFTAAELEMLLGANAARLYF